jgi:type II secretory pathway component PulF
MRTLAELMPPTMKEKLQATADSWIEGECIVPNMELLGILPRFAVEMIAVGEEGGHLDSALERIAEIFKHDLECRLLAET